MAVIRDMNSPERKKLNGENDSHERSRSLNDFHDAILKHILSFLPTKVAAKTSVLSKRWEYMWTSLPNLDFEEGSTERKQFMDFVDRALILHNVSLLRKLSLHCLVEDDVSHIKAWMSGAVRRNAQEFDISFNDYPDFVPANDQYVLPFCLFSCETVEVLKLQIYFDFQLPPQICLPRLKTLTLKCITFKDYHPTNLLFASLALEELFLEECTWKGDKNEVIISAPKLRKLTINEFEEDCGGYSSSSTSIIVSAPELKHFKHGGRFLKDYHFPRSTSIIEATLRFHSYMKKTDIITNHFDEVLRSLQLVKYLRLSPSSFWALSHATVPILKNLIILDVVDCQLELTCEELEMVVNKCPRLKTLSFHEGINFDSETDNFNRISKLKFIYLPSTLKKIEIGHFGGKIKEISFIQILLAKLTSLKSMKIFFGRNADIAMREEIESLLSVLPRGSKSCKLTMKWPQRFFFLEQDC